MRDTRVRAKQYEYEMAHAKSRIQELPPESQAELARLAEEIEANLKAVSDFRSTWDDELSSIGATSQYALLDLEASRREDTRANGWEGKSS